MAIIKHPSNEDEFLLVKEAPPPKFGEEEYDSYVDSDLWDLPSAQLNLLDGESPCGVAVEGVESVIEKIDLTKFDLNLALNQVALTAQFNLLKNICFFFLDFNYVRNSIQLYPSQDISAFWIYPRLLMSFHRLKAIVYLLFLFICSMQFERFWRKWVMECPAGCSGVCGSMRRRLNLGLELQFIRSSLLGSWYQWMTLHKV